MDNDKMLSPEQGADRVAERWKKRQEDHLSQNGYEIESDKLEDDDESTPNYKCENCNSSVFIVNYTFDERQNIRLNYTCSCGDTDIAAEEEFHVTRTNRWIGYLDSGHRVEWEDKDSEEVDREKVDFNIFCRRCFESQDIEWEIEHLNDWEYEDDSVYFEVLCDTCAHEIEFGWSHPNRGGRIWPCESSDFNPWKCFPETRFISNWKRRGWLRPRKKIVNKK